MRNIRPETQINGQILYKQNLISIKRFIKTIF